MATIWPKWYTSSMTGLGALAQTAGALVTMLDKILVDGFDEVTLDSLVVASGVATGTRAAGIPFLAYQVIKVAGITDETSLNTEHRVIAVNSTTFTFDATGISDGTLTGTITTKVPSLGWETVYTATNKRVYRPTDIAATGCVIRIDDTYTGYSRCNGYGAMSDIDTGTDQFPSSTAYVAFHKSNSSTARGFALVGDSRFFWFSALYSGATHAGAIPAAFGDIDSWNTVAPQWDCTLFGPSGQGGACYLHYMNLGSLAYGHTPRQYTGSVWSGTPRQFARGNAFILSTQSTNNTYPTNAAAGLMVSAPTICQEYGGFARGLWPGLCSIGCDVGASLTVFALLDVTGFAHKLMAFPTEGYWVAIDLGPWR